MDIRPGAFYSNGHFGRSWEVRQVMALPPCGEPEGCVRYKVVVGERRRHREVCAMEEFARWARYEVVRNETTWERVNGRSH